MVQSRDMTRGSTTANLSRLREKVKSVNPLVAATLRNAVPKNGRAPEANELTAGNERNAIMPHKLERISNIIANNINAAHDLRAITPYIDRAELIWSSLLLYPNGKQKNILEYSTRSSRYKNTPLHTALLKVWKDYFTNDYKIEDELREQIDDMLWNTGSYATLTLSRISLDYLINGMEVVDRAGNEDMKPIHTYQATQGNFTFDRSTGKMRVMNVGNYVRPPEDKGDDVFNVAGLESVMGSMQNVKTSSQAEFDILKGTPLEGSAFNITFTDNPATLATNLLAEKKKKFNEKFYSGNEDFASLIQQTLSNANAKPDDRDKTVTEKGDGKENRPDKPRATVKNMSMGTLNSLQHDIFPHRRAANQFMQFVKQDTDLGVANYGTPIDWHVPSAAIIPIHINGNVRKKKDYVILFDPDTGEFLNNVTDFQYYQSSKKLSDGIGNKNQQGGTNSLIDNLKQIQQGKDCDFDMTEFAELSKGIIIESFMKSVISGRSGTISVDLDEETNKIFLARMFRGQGIRALYVPGECVTYAAFKYNALGVGQSLTQSAKMHIARLAAMDLADAMANMEAAQSSNKMRIVLNKDDPNPERTIAMAREVFFRANPRFYNVLATNQMSIPVLVDAFRELSLTLEVDAGENPYLPVPNISVEPQEKQHFRKVDSDSRNEVLNKIANYFMLPRSWLDVADENNNFQIEALNEHRLVYNQALNWQEQIADFVMERERKYVRVNQPLLLSLIQTISDQRKLWTPDNKEVEMPKGSEADTIELILEDFLNNIECSLPAPAVMEQAAKLKEGLSTVNELVTQWWDANGKTALIDKALETLNIGGEYSKEQIEAMVKAYLYQKAHKYLNIPSPFDDAVDDPSGGGMAGIVESVVLQNNKLYSFLSNLALRDLEERGKAVKSMEPKLEKALEKFQTIAGTEDENEQQPGPFNAEGGGNEPSLDDGATPPDDGTQADDLNPENTDENLDDENKPDDENNDETKPDDNEKPDDVKPEDKADAEVSEDAKKLSDTKEGGENPFGI